MNHASLFSGIGGFDLAAEWMGWNNVLSCEIEPFCQKVLKYYWPKAIHYENIKTTDFTIHRGQVDIITGGFPCQPFSMAGKRRGTEDDRHLWPEMLRAIREIKPRWVVGENVFGFVNWSGGMVFREVISDLENEGYEVQPFIIPAAAVNAPHRRDRVWIIAHAKNLRDQRNTGTMGEKTAKPIGQNDGAEFDGCCQDGPPADTDKDGFNRGNCEHEINASERGVDALNDVIPNVTPDTERERMEGNRAEGQQITEAQAGEGLSGCDNGGAMRNAWADFPTVSPLCMRNDGFSLGLVGITFPKWRNESIKALGNAIVPQVVYEIFKSIERYEKLYRIVDKII